MNDTIAAVATAPGVGGVGIVRVSVLMLVSLLLLLVVGFLRLQCVRLRRAMMPA